MSFEEPFYIGRYPNYENTVGAMTESNLKALKNYCGYTWQNLSKVKQTALLIIPPVIMLTGLVVSLICQDNCQTTGGEMQCTSLCNNGTKIAAAVFGIAGGVGTLASMASLNCAHQAESP